MDAVPGPDGDGQWLAREPGRVDVAGPGEHEPVGGDPLAGADQDLVTDDQLGHRDQPVVGTMVPGAIRQNSGRLRGQVEQRVDARPGARGHHGLERAGTREDDDQQGAVEVLADGRGGDGGHHHQQVDVEPALRQRPQALHRGLPASGEVADDVERAHENGGSAEQVGGNGEGEGQERQRRPPDLGQGPHGSKHNCAYTQIRSKVLPELLLRCSLAACTTASRAS